MYLKFLWLACFILVMVMSLREDGKTKRKQENEESKSEASTSAGESEDDLIEFTELEESVEYRRQLKSKHRS